MFDAVLFLSYGGPESPEAVEPFLDRVLSGKRVPAARRDAVRDRYLRFGGVSPLPQECRQFLETLETSFHENGDRVGLYFGTLYSSPFVADALEKMERDGVKSVLVFKSSAFVCRHYVDAVLDALTLRSARFKERLVVRFVPPFFETHAFLNSLANSIQTALAGARRSAPDATRLVLFTAHSIPVADSDAIQYRRQLLHAIVGALETAFPEQATSTCPQTDETSGYFPSAPLSFAVPQELEQVPETLRARLRNLGLDAALAFQSRSGSPFVPWLEPDVNAFLRKYRKETSSLEGVVVVPIGFFFENMETIYDLDVEARETCASLGIEYRRAQCVGASSAMADATRKLALLDPSDFPLCVCPRGRCDLSCRLNPSF